MPYLYYITGTRGSQVRLGDKAYRLALERCLVATWKVTRSFGHIRPPWSLTYLTLTLPVAEANSSRLSVPDMPFRSFRSPRLGPSTPEDLIYAGRRTGHPSDSPRLLMPLLYSLLKGPLIFFSPLTQGLGKLFFSGPGLV